VHKKLTKLESKYESTKRKTNKLSYSRPAQDVRHSTAMTNLGQT